MHMDLNGLDLTDDLMWNTPCLEACARMCVHEACVRSCVLACAYLLASAQNKDVQEHVHQG